MSVGSQQPNTASTKVGCPPQTCPSLGDPFSVRPGLRAPVCFLPSGLPRTLKLILEEKSQRGLAGDGPCALLRDLAVLPRSLQSPGETGKVRRTREHLGGLCPWGRPSGAVIIHCGRPWRLGR